MARELELSPAQVAQAKLAGIPGDRPGLGDEYPRMLYLKTAAPKGIHKLLDMALDMQGVPNVDWVVVDSAEEEAEAMEHGWTRTIDGKAEPQASEKDDLIAELQAQIAAQAALLNDAPRRGRPPKAVDEPGAE